MAAAVGRRGAIHGINITPLVDIFLVLLILVMISSTIVEQQGIEVQVPKATRSTTVAPGASGLVLMADGKWMLDGITADPSLVLGRLRAKVATDSAHTVLLSADAKLPYENVIAALDIVKQAGIHKYTLRVQKAVS